jgi:hypothetical protein
VETSTEKPLTGPLITLRDEDGAETRQVQLRYTMEHFCALEEKYGDLDKYGEAISKTPMAGRREAVALAMGIDIRDEEAVKAFGARMVGTPASYDAAFGEAWAVANGMDPTSAAELFENAAATVAEAQMMLNRTGLAGLTEPEPEPNGKGKPPRALQDRQPKKAASSRALGANIVDKRKAATEAEANATAPDTAGGETTEQPVDQPVEASTPAEEAG